MLELYDHQQEALDKLHNGSILWGSVGSGKSITGLMYYVKVCGGLVGSRTLYIITTARKRDTGEWERECARIGMKDSRIIDSWNNIKKYTDVKDAFFIFDEQRVVGYGAWVSAFLSITKKNQWILLSATPGDCWMDYVPVFIANGFYKSKREFQRDHVLYNMYNTRYPQIKGYCNEKILRKYRDKILVGMTYEKSTAPHESVVKCNYDRELYSKTMRSRWNPYSNEPIKEASELCLVLRRIVNSDEDRIGKLRSLIFQHGKVIIFYNYNYELDILRYVAESIGWPCGEWNGHRHEPIPSAGHWMYLVQYTAGAEGWNCIETDTVIFFSESYSYKAMVQAAGRIDRINTGYHDLYYYHLVSNSAIDRAIQKALSNKKNFNESAFVGEMTQKATERIASSKECS